MTVRGLGENNERYSLLRLKKRAKARHDEPTSHTYEFAAKRKAINPFYLP